MSRTLNHPKALLALALAGVALGGCEKKPEGQVVATVNGEEVTRRELASEFAAVGGKNGDDIATVQPALVQAIVTRKLLVQEAERTNLDKNPQYLALSKRGQEALLAQMLTESWMGKLKPLGKENIPAFVAANPLMFGQRKILLCDTITTSTGSVSEAQLRKLNTNDQIAAWLTANKKPFQRADKPIDTMSLPKELAQQLVAKAGNGPMAINSNGAYSIVTVKGIREAPVPANQVARVAQAAMMQRQQMQTGEEQLKRLRSSADISYLPGFGPPAAAK